MPTGVILSLCDRSGNWSRPYREAGYDVRQVDLVRGEDVRLLSHLACEVHGILAAPPCNHFARSGARWWGKKGETALIEGLSIVDACLRAVSIYQPRWWCLENPIGRLQDFLGPPAFKFDPCDFGDPWTKRTWLWGDFNPPAGARVEPIRGDVTTGTRGPKRSATPMGFARAFFQANP